MKNYLAIGRKLNLNAFGLLPSSWDLGWIEGTTGSGGGGEGCWRSRISRASAMAAAKGSP